MLEEISYYRNKSASLRTELYSDELAIPNAKKQILLIDDDPVFSKIMKRAAELKGIVIKSCRNLEEIDKFTLGDYAVILVDYLLEEHTGLELASYFKTHKWDTPIILISHTNHVPRIQEWPCNVREFVHKKLGPYAILEAAIEAYEIEEIDIGRSSRLYKGELY